MWRKDGTPPSNRVGGNKVKFTRPLHQQERISIAWIPMGPARDKTEILLIDIYKINIQRIIQRLCKIDILALFTNNENGLYNQTLAYK